MPGPSGTATFGGFLGQPTKAPALPTASSATLTDNQHPDFPHSPPAFPQVLVHGKYHCFGEEDLQTLQQPCVLWVLCNAKLLAGSHYNLTVWSGEHLLPIPQSSPVSCVMLSKLLIFYINFLINTNISA